MQIASRRDFITRMKDFIRVGNVFRTHRNKNINEVNLFISSGNDFISRTNLFIGEGNRKISIFFMEVLCQTRKVTQLLRSHKLPIPSNDDRYNPKDNRPSHSCKSVE